MKKLLKLSEIIPKLEKEIIRVRLTVTPLINRSRFSKKRAFKLLILHNYNEVVLILKRILNTLERIKEINEDLINESLREIEDEKLILEHISLTSYLIVDVKSLYLWVAHIKDVMEKSGVAIDLSELYRISFLRHKFITHIHDQPFFMNHLETIWALMFNFENENVEILFHHHYSKKRFKDFKSIVKKAKSFIPEFASERNYWHQLYLLYSNRNKISDKNIEKDVNEMITRVGIKTEPPNVIAAALLDVLRNLNRKKR